jgi:NAD(P)H-dependent FMN reductase
MSYEIILAAISQPPSSFYGIQYGGNYHGLKVELMLRNVLVYPKTTNAESFAATARVRGIIYMG